MAIDLDAIRKKHEQFQNQNSGGGDFVNNFLQLKDGKNTVRFLPSSDDEKLFYAETKIHRIPNEEGQVKNVHCRKVHGEDCPLCTIYYKLWDMFNKGGKEDTSLSDLAKQIKPRQRYYMNVLDRETGEVKILSVGQIIMQKVIGTIMDEDYGDITDITTGRDFVIHKVMEGPWPKYDQSSARPRITPLSDKKKQIAEIMDNLHDIQKLVRLEDYDEVRNMAEGILPGSTYGEESKKDNTEGKSDVSDEDYEKGLKGQNV